MDKDYFCQERDFYQDQLLNNILPFWLKYGRDDQCGGYHTCLNRDGSVFDYDKICTWGQGRIIWTFAYLYNEFRQEPKWLDMAMHGVDFMLKFGFYESGRVYYSLSRAEIDSRSRHPENPADGRIFPDGGCLSAILLGGMCNHAPSRT